MAEKLKFEDLQSPLLTQRKGEETFQKVGVIGLGVMGQGIAETIATAGIEVIGIERDPDALKNGLDCLPKDGVVPNFLRNKWRMT